MSFRGACKRVTVTAQTDTVLRRTLRGPAKSFLTLVKPSLLSKLVMQRMSRGHAGRPRDPPKHRPTRLMRGFRPRSRPRPRPRRTVEKRAEDEPGAAGASGPFKRAQQITPARSPSATLPESGARFLSLAGDGCAPRPARRVGVGVRRTSSSPPPRFRADDPS